MKAEVGTGNREIGITKIAGYIMGSIIQGSNTSMLVHYHYYNTIAHVRCDFLVGSTDMGIDDWA